MTREMSLIAYEMNKKQFNELITYISNRPEEARRLSEVLTAVMQIAHQSDCKQDYGDKCNSGVSDSQWLTASQVGKEMGRSRQWVKDKDGVLPSSSKRIGARGSHLYLWNENTRHLFNNQL